LAGGLLLHPLLFLSFVEPLGEGAEDLHPDDQKKDEPADVLHGWIVR
jgi:hypothetical protein